LAADPRDRIALPAVFLGVLAVGAAAIFIRLADAPALGIAFWRCTFGVVALSPLAALRRERLPKGRDLWVGVLAGIALGAHFGTWIASLDYTSVAASVVLVSTTPVFVAVAAYLLLGERTTVLSFAGIVLAIAGTAVIAGGGTGIGEAAFFGNVLALLGAVAMAVYVLIGRSLRTGGVGALPYSIVGYSAAALALLPLALLSGAQLWGYSAATWFWLFVITLGPQLLGHTVLNWASGVAGSLREAGIGDAARRPHRTRRAVPPAAGRHIWPNTPRVPGYRLAPWPDAIPHSLLRTTRKMPMLATPAISAASITSGTESAGPPVPGMCFTVAEAEADAEADAAEEPNNASTIASWMWVFS
jgi:drug/metabolite transporter (DMT)-like permease